MKKANLIRYYGDFYCTLGIITVEGIIDPIWHTIELPWKDNEKFISCIPKGSYICVPIKNEKYNPYPDIWRLQDVPNRQGIDIHVLNRAEQSEGCIGPGLSAGYMKYKNPDVGMGKAVLNSSAAMSQMKTVIGWEKFELTVR